MKVLIVGRGVVGTIHGWALSKAGIDVTHVVRKDNLPSAATLDLLDLRPGYPKNTRATYLPKTVRQIGPADAFDLVIIATKHYQAAEAIRQYLPGAPRATFLLFTANWEGTAEIDRLLPRSSLLWGYASASGGPDDRGTLVVTVNPSVRFGMLEGSDPEKFNAVGKLFERAGFTLDIKANIVEWLWVHHAINAGGIGTALWAGGIAEATRSFKTLRLGTWATREALDVVAARGVYLEHYPDAKSVFNTPIWLAGVAITYFVRFTGKGRRLLGASHFANSPDEMKRYYFDVLNTGEKLGVAMPHLSALRERIECYPAVTTHLSKS
ncbi:MAG: 2-dehydropantoate 2-reductase N-terminal domain-containing protein [Bryobacteraceae bacterium]